MSKKKLRNTYEFIDKPVGEGAYGVVYKAMDLKRNVPVAVKKIRMDDENEGIPATALREIAILKELIHPNVVKLLDVEHQSNKYYLVFEWVDQDLKKYIEECRTTDGVPIAMIRSIMYQILDGLDFCHSHSVFHRDLKPHNILIDKKGVVRIADFGLSRAFAIPLRNYTHEVVTLWYRAPEILLGARRYSLPIDIWSVGCVFAELCDGRALWPGDSEIDQIFRIFRTLGTPNERTWVGVEAMPEYKPVFPKWPPLPLKRVVDRQDKLTRKGQDLLKKMFVYDPAERITGRAAMHHEYFRDLRRTGSRDFPIVIE